MKSEDSMKIGAGVLQPGLVEIWRNLKVGYIRGKAKTVLRIDVIWLNMKVVFFNGQGNPNIGEDYYCFNKDIELYKNKIIVENTNELPQKLGLIIKKAYSKYSKSIII